MQGHFQQYIGDAEIRGRAVLCRGGFIFSLSFRQGYRTCCWLLAGSTWT